MWATSISAAVLGVSIDAEASIIYVLLGTDDRVFMVWFDEQPNGSFRSKSELDLEGPVDGRWYLESAVARSGRDSRVHVAGPVARTMIFGLHTHRVPIGYSQHGASTHLLFNDNFRHYWDWSDGFLHCRSPEGAILVRCAPHWTPGIPPGSSLATPVVDYLTPAPGELEIVGIDADGILHWMSIKIAEPATEVDTATYTDGAGFRAACLLAPGVVAAANGKNEILRIRRGAQQCIARSMHPAKIVALADNPGSRTLLAIFDDASAFVCPAFA